MLERGGHVRVHGPREPRGPHGVALAAVSGVAIDCEGRRSRGRTCKCSWLGQDREGRRCFWKASSSTKVGTVHLHLSVHDACKTVVSPFTEGSRNGRLMHCTERTGEYVIIDSSDLIRSAIYARTANAVDVILKPDEVSR